MKRFLKVLLSGLFMVVSVYGANSMMTLTSRVKPRLTIHLADGVTQNIPLKLCSSQALNRANHLSYTTNGFELELVFIDQGSYVECNGTVLSTDGGEHCVTVDLAIPVENLFSYHWDQNIDDSVPITATQSQYSEYVDIATQHPPDGSFNANEQSNGGYNDLVGTGQMSYYPLASISSDTQGYAWAVDMGLPLVYRLSVQADRGVVAEFDLGISPETQKFPNRGHFKLYLFEHASQWGFRSALANYYSIQAEFFKKRVEHEGIWLPFTPLFTIEGWQDFGFAFHETGHVTNDKGMDPAVPTMLADKQAPEVYSFQYTEPWDVQIPIQTLGAPYATVIGAETIPEDHLQYFPSSVTLDKQGLYQARRLETPWFKSGWAVSITTNVDPELPSPNRFEYVLRTEISPALALDADGIYFDSMEWNWHHDLNYDQNHFKYADYPLTFSKSANPPRPAIWNYSSEYEMMNQIADEMHGAGKLVMGNGFGWTPFSAGILDLFGAEFSWFHAADYDSRILQFRRSIAYQKPIVVLLNEGFSGDDFTKAPYDGYRVYFERMLFYGFFPSFFSADASNDPYWEDSKNYNIGRPFFKKYIPLIQRIAAAGWEPLTGAKADHKDIRLERFGSTQELYFTVMNTSESIVNTEITIDYRALGVSKPHSIMELIAGEGLGRVKISRKHVRFRLTLPPNSTRLLEITG